MKRFFPKHSKVVLGFTIAAAIWIAAPSASANVYATNIKLNGNLTNAIASPGGNVNISYILNERASLGVTVDVLQNSTLIRRFSLPENGPGTERGANSIVWDLRDGSSNSVPPGTYRISITARSQGYSDWTQISPESDNVNVWDGRGISVDQNPASPYFGRIFIANAKVGNDPANNPGDNLGILKYNADASAPDDGIASTGGRDWPGNDLGPWKIEAFGDYVYANDLALNGQVFRWDPTVTSNSLTQVLQQNNVPGGASLSGLALLTQGTNTQLWMTDAASSLGVLRWTLDAEGKCIPDDKGTNVVGLGSDTNGLTLPPQDVALDRDGNIYVCQSLTGHADPTQRVFRYRAYDPSTNGGQPEITAEWAVGAGDDSYGGASGIAADPTGTYVAVAFQGVFVAGANESGNTKVLYATNGALVANLDLNLVILGDPNHQDTDCVWDAAGNVYCIDNWWGRWRAFSPPGTNQMVTLAPAAVIVGGTDSNPPTIAGISVTNGYATIVFTGSASDSASSFVVLASPNLVGPFTVVEAASITSSGPGMFTAVLPVSGAMQFFDVRRQTSPPSQQPAITGITVSAGIVSITFTGAMADTPSAFSLLSAGSLNDVYALVLEAQITSVSAGTFRATAPINGPMRFYRIQK